MLARYKPHKDCTRLRFVLVFAYNRNLTRANTSNRLPMAKRKTTPTLKQMADSAVSLPGMSYASHNQPNLACSPDGKTAAIAHKHSSKKYQSSPHGFTYDFFEVLIWNVENQTAITTIDGCSGEVSDLKFTPDGKQLLCAGSDKDDFSGGEITFWNTKTWQLIDTIKTNISVNALAIDSSGQWAATATRVYSDGMKKLALYDIAERKLIREFAPELKGGVDSIAISPNGKFIAAGGAGTVSLWLSKSGRKKKIEAAHENTIHVAFSPDGKTLASCGDESVILWDVKTLTPRQFLPRQAHRVAAICYSTDGVHLASAFQNNLQLWNAESTELVRSLTFGAPEKTVAHASSLFFWPDDETLTSVHYHGYLSQFSLQNKHWKAPVAYETPATNVEDSKEAVRLRKQIIADPIPDEPRLRYADWLEENGDADRAEFIRKQCELHEYRSLNHEQRKQHAAKISGLQRRVNNLLADNFPKWTSRLRSLNLSVDDIEFQRGMMQLVRMTSIEFTDASLKILANVPELESVNLNGSKVTDQGLVHLKPLKNLHWLDVTDTEVTTAGLHNLRSFKKLYRVYQASWGNGENPELQKFMQIRNRAFNNLPADEQRAEALRALDYILDIGVRLDENGEMKDVSYSQSWATDADLVYLKAIPETETLTFFECRAVTSKGLKQLAVLPNLRDLRLTESGVTDLKPLAKIPSLESLDLSSLEELDESSFRYLAKLPKLKNLTIHFCYLSDAIMPHIAKIASLEKLEMHYNEISDDALMLLRDCKKLKVLDCDYQDRRKKLIAELTT